MKKERIVYLDYLRVVALIAVMVLHVASQNWLGLAGSSFEWNVFHIFDSMVRWGVPGFLMISGTLFLPKEIDLKTLFTKYILRLAVAYLVWSTVYALVIHLGRAFLYENFELSYKKIIADIISGSYHMWFIPMLAGIYLCLPILQQIVKNKKVMYYFLLVSFVFAFVLPQLVQMCNDFTDNLFVAGVNALYHVVADMKMDLLLGYGFYFVLGYALSTVELSKKQRVIVYVLGLVGIVTTIVLNGVIAWQTDKPYVVYYSNFAVNVALPAIAAYIWFKHKQYKNAKCNSLFAHLAQYSFGAYLVHILVMAGLAKLNLATWSFNPLLSVPVISVLMIVISYGISFVLNKIPFVKKWFV